MTKTPFLLSFVIPVFNEADRLEKTFEALRCFKTDVAKIEVVFVNDGSTDRTTDRISDFLVSYPSGRLVSYTKNRGKGYAVTRGMLEAVGDYRLCFDADMSTPLAEFEKCITHIVRGIDVIIGTRKTKQATLIERQSFVREAMGKVFTFLANQMVGTNVSDFTCGFKCFSKRAAESIFAVTRIERWAYDVEILLYTHLLGYSLVEVPVVWKNDRATSVRLFKDTIKSFIDLVRVRLCGKRWVAKRRNPLL